MDNSLEVLVYQCRERRNSISDSLVSGVAKDYAEYRAICGEIRGLLSAEQLIMDLAKNMETSDE
jgi:hypothetical protein